MKLKPLPINSPASGWVSVPLEMKIARIDPGTQPCPAWLACGVTLLVPEAAACDVVEAAEEARERGADERALRVVESGSAAVEFAAARCRAVAAGAGTLADGEAAGPRAAAPAGAVVAPERCAFDPCDVAVRLDESAFAAVSAPATPRPWGPANARTVTNVAAPNRVVSLVARRLLSELRDLDTASP